MFHGVSLCASSNKIPFRIHLPFCERSTRMISVNGSEPRTPEVVCGVKEYGCSVTSVTTVLPLPSLLRIPFYKNCRRLYRDQYSSSVSTYQKLNGVSYLPIRARATTPVNEPGNLCVVRPFAFGVSGCNIR